MRNRVLTLSLCLSTLASTGFGQVLSNSSLTGKYFVRHVQFTTDANNNATDARTDAIGSFHGGISGLLQIFVDG